MWRSRSTVLQLQLLQSRMLFGITLVSFGVNYGGSGVSLASLSKKSHLTLLKRGSSRFIYNSFPFSYPRPHMISACHNSKLVSTFVSSSRSRVLRHVAIRSNCLVLNDPSDPPTLEKGQMRFFRSDPPDPP